MPEKRRQPRKPKHDAAYKRIFAHARTTADLLRGFVGDLAHHLDFTTLERLPASFVTEHLGQRHADLLWKMQTVKRYPVSWLATSPGIGIFSLISRHSIHCCFRSRTWSRW